MSSVNQIPQTSSARQAIYVSTAESDLGMQTLRVLLRGHFYIRRESALPDATASFAFVDPLAWRERGSRVETSAYSTERNAVVDIKRD